MRATVTNERKSVTLCVTMGVQSRTRRSGTDALGAFVTGLVRGSAAGSALWTGCAGVCVIRSVLAGTRVVGTGGTGGEGGRTEE